jgi:hypothetical protein
MSHAAAKHRQLDRRFVDALDRDGDGAAAGGDHALVRSQDRLRDQRTMTDAPRGRRQADRPRVQLAELWERRSARTGTTYLAGFLGGLRLVGFAETRAHPKTGEQITIWKLYASEAEAPRREGG